MKKFFILLFLVISIQASAQSDESAIRQLLDKQTAAWNRGDIDSFMIGYWENDSLMFISKSSVTYGWKNTLNNYKKNYPDTTAMGKLDFTLISFEKLSSEYFHVVGKWHLHRSIGDLNGHFTLLLKKIKNSWVIVADHSS